ncbi:MAG: EscI/YscI/HrpB family type III secretion system inner rod protein [Comamonas sp.]
MEIIASLASARLAPLPGTELAAAPSAATTAQFAALMQAPLGAPLVAPVSAVSAFGPASLPAAPVSGAATSVGNRILNGMHGISSEIRATWTEVADTLRADRPELGMQEILGLQLRLTMASLGVELVSKAVSSATQTFDKVVHVQ